MLIRNTKIKEIEKLVKDIETSTNKRSKKDKRIAKIRIDLQKMSRERLSVERSGREERIRVFNKKFLQLLSEISRLVQTTGTSDRDKIARYVREIQSN